MVKKILILFLFIVVVIQFFRIDKENPAYDAANDLIAVESPPEDIRIILEQACYDCHSYESEYPWYSNVAPVSWWLKSHINEGREHFNFSEWANYDAERRDHKLEEFVEMIEEEEMPLKSYTWMHEDSRLTDEQRSALIAWAKGIR